MTGIVHCLVGAAVGSLFKSRAGAFVAGVVSHAVADAIPHRDIDPTVDVPVTIALLSGVAVKYGLESNELAGAVGGVSPDFEHALEQIGLDNKFFPTHIDHGKYHGAKEKTYLTQYLAAGAALLVLALNKKE